MEFRKSPSWATEDHRLLAESCNRFFADELVPHIDEWRDAGVVDREFWRKAGAAGLLGCSVPEEYGGSGTDVSFDAIVGIAHMHSGDGNWGWSAHNIAMHYYLAYGTEQQKERWLPGLTNGNLVAAIAMTEPGTGSDLQAVKTNARDEGSHYVLNGSKTYITNGQTADLIIVVCKTDKDLGAKGISLLVLETKEAEGFSRGKNLKKLGLDGADTSELFFDEVKIPKENLLGEEGKGFVYLMKQLPWERLMLGVLGIAQIELTLEQTLAYVRERKTFGQRLIDYQNTRIKLAEAYTKLEVTRAFNDRCMEQLMDGTLTSEFASMSKWWTAQVGNEVTDECLQLFGGAGLMLEYPIAHAYRDARFAKIVGGSNEIMKEMIARPMMR